MSMTDDERRVTFLDHEDLQDAYPWRWVPTKGLRRETVSVRAELDGLRQAGSYQVPVLVQDRWYLWEEGTGWLVVVPQGRA
jgi:hypothetical protein